MTHFDEMTCMLYLEGQLERPRALELSAHVAGCAECRALLRALEGESRLLSHALVEEDEAVPARLLATPVRDAIPWAWIISFGLAAAGAYTLWTGIIQPWQQQLSQAGIGGESLLTLLLFRGAFWKGWGSMANTVEMLALGTLGLVAIGLLRRRLRRWTTLAVVMGAIAAALVLPTAATAAEVHKHMQSYTLSAGETVKNDLILFADNIRIDGTVEGDLIVFCRTLTINGHVTGDVIGFAQLLRIHGPVDGNIRGFANTVTLDNTVGKNLMAFIENFELDSKGQVGGGAIVFAGHATLDGRVRRDLMAFAGRSNLNGPVGGNVEIRGEHLTIGSTAQVAGKTAFHGHYKPDVDPAAKLASPLSFEIMQERPNYSQPRWYWHQVLGWGAAFLFGLVAILLMPSFFNDVLRSSERYGPAFGFGALTLVATPILAVIACVTIVGLAVGIGTLLLWLVALYSAQVFIGTWLGGAMLGKSSGTGALIGRLALGLLVLKVAGGLPYLGFWVRLACLIWGMGALVLALYRRTQSQPYPPPPAQAVAA